MRRGRNRARAVFNVLFERSLENEWSASVGLHEEVCGIDDRLSATQ